MKVLHINSYYATGKFYKNLYDEQIYDGLDIDVYVPVDKSYSCKFNLGEYTTLSRCYNMNDRFIFYLKQNKILNNIKKTYDIKKYDIIHAHSLFSNGYIAFKLKKEFNIPYVVAIRNTDINIFLKYMLNMRKIGLEIIKNANRIIFISNPYKKILFNKYIPNYFITETMNKSSVITNGLDKFWINNVIDYKRTLELYEINILYVGNINKNKNIVSTIKAIHILIKKGYNIKFNVVGKIINKKIYKNISNYRFVNYIGEVYNNQELISIYRKNHIFCMPSIHETFGLVYLEAMSQGLPLIYTRGQGFDGQFEDGQIGYSVNCLDYIEISNKIEFIIKNYENISIKCVEECIKYDWSTIVEKYSKIYRCL